MKEKLFAGVVALVLLGVIFCITFFKTTSLYPKSVVVESSKTYFDIDDKPIMYKFSIVGELHYSKWFNPWKRESFEDSLFAANQRIMDDYFKTRYIEKVSDDTIIQNFDVEKYFHTPMSFDSIFFKIKIVKEISLTKNYSLRE